MRVTTRVLFIAPFGLLFRNNFLVAIWLVSYYGGACAYLSRNLPREDKENRVVPYFMVAPFLLVLSRSIMVHDPQSMSHGYKRSALRKFMMVHNPQSMSHG
jgi:hypothetical protein